MTIQKKPKPVKLEWQGSISNSLNSSDSEAVSIKNSEKKNEVLQEKNAKHLSGKAHIKIEKKGRAGKPVIIIYNFSDPESQNQESLKKLCASLKNKLACGGTIENNEILLTIRDVEKVKAALLSLNIIIS
ncbi:translation initiation factor [Spirobacillus cienkowskii]|uniref:translation initiation factor n=1 Tax=Spirobacillus cienkowskii TaxID=495820 RepID=UPI0030CBF6E8